MNCIDCDDGDQDEPEVTVEPKQEEVRQNLSPLSASSFLVDFPTLIQGLERCRDCPVPLSLSDAVGVDADGLGGLLHIVCQNCSTLNKIHFNKHHKNHLTGRRVFDGNTRLALG